VGKKQMKLSVAMCTYNGTAHLRQQLDSIAAQARRPDELVFCDDGSTDATISIVRDFAADAPFPVHVHINSINLGVTANFFRAMELCSSDLIAFSDQDDVWLPHKLARAEKMIHQSTDPAGTLYCSRLQYVNASLVPLGLSPLPSAIGFQNAIVENIATGCSVVFGSDVRRRILQAAPADMMMHDWWAYLVASAYGQVVYDETPTVLYRQHGGNVAGWEPKPLKIWNRTKWLVRRLLTDSRGMDSLNQAARFIATYPDIPQENRQLVEELLRLRDAGVLSRTRYVLHPRVQRNDAIENLGLKAMLLMGWH
jgi:glycosyltransferase involved in cell wall biosynthesis